MRLEEVGYWSEVKLEIVKEYAQAYSTILSAQRNPRLRHIYIDAFAGAGEHISRGTGEFIPGRPLNALLVNPPFEEYHFIDLNGQKAERLRSLTSDLPNVTVYQGDCNPILLIQVFPRAIYENYRRALCLLDPYGLHLKWDVISTAARMKSVEIFLNFPILDMNRNVLLRNPDRVSAKQVARLDAFWGDDSWRQAAYSTRNLFGFEMKPDQANEAVAEAFRARLKTNAGFQFVPEPMPMRNSRGATVYYLIFAAQRPIAAKIVDDIFRKFAERGIARGQSIDKS
jgi:three-Cys-motif partner protein